MLAEDPAIRKRREHNRRYSASARGRQTARLWLQKQTPEQRARRRECRRQSYHKCRKQAWLVEMQLTYGLDPHSDKDIYSTLNIDETDWTPDVY